MTIHTLGSENTVLSKFIAVIRDRRFHTDSMRFRRNLERLRPQRFLRTPRAETLPL